MTITALSIVGLALSWIVGTTFNVFVQIGRALSPGRRWIAKPKGC